MIISNLRDKSVEITRVVTLVQLKNWPTSNLL